MRLKKNKHMLKLHVLCYNKKYTKVWKWTKSAFEKDRYFYCENVCYYELVPRLVIGCVL